MFQSKLNCEILYDDLAFEVRWAVAGDSIVIQLVAKLGTHTDTSYFQAPPHFPPKLPLPLTYYSFVITEKGEYMSFGVSGQIDRNVMIGADVVVAWIDHETLNGYAYDYFLDSKSQCAGNRGSCPDVKLQVPVVRPKNTSITQSHFANATIISRRQTRKAYDYWTQLWWTDTPSWPTKDRWERTMNSICQSIRTAPKLSSGLLVRSILRRKYPTIA